MLKNLTWDDLLIPSVALLGAILLGWLIEAVLMRWLRRMAARTRWQGDDAIITSLKGLPRLWLAVVALYVVRYRLPLDNQMDYIVGRTLLVLLIFSFILLASRIAVRLLNWRLKRHRSLAGSSSIFTTVTQILVFMVGFLVILQSLGISITPLLATLGVGGLAVALALQPTLSNLFSGLQILGAGQIRPGDFVRLGSGQDGYVLDISWRNTSIHTVHNNLVIIPNAELADAIVTNYFQPEPEMTFKVTGGVAYDTDLAHAERVTKAVALAIQQLPDGGGVPDHDPVFRYEAFGESSINWYVMLKSTEYRTQFKLRSEFIKALHVRYQQEGINIPFPIRTLQIQRAAAANGIDA